MNSTEKVLRYAPDIYIDNDDMLAVYNGQKTEITIAGEKSYQAFLNNFVKSCDLEGIRRWEKIFNILADEINETLDFRKGRVINKLIQQPPYTKIFIEQMLEGIFGIGNYDVQIIYNDYIIKIYIETSIDGLYIDTFKNIQKMIPANMTIEAIQGEPYLHIYLQKKYTYGDIEQFTYGELSQYAEEINA